MSVPSTNQESRYSPLRGASRRDDALLVIARTGAVKNESFDAAVAHTKLYREAGADLLMLMPATDEQWAEAPRRIGGEAWTGTSSTRWEGAA